MEIPSKRKLSFFLDLLKKKIWGRFKITLSNNFKEFENFFLNLKSYYNRILKFKIKNSKRIFYSFSKKKNAESIDLLKNRLKIFKSEILEEELEREKFLKRKGKNLILFLNESDFLSRTLKLDLVYKNMKIGKSKKVKNTKKKINRNFQFIYFFPFQKNFCFLEFFFSKIMLFPKNYIFESKKKNLFTFFFPKVSISIFYSIEYFRNFKSLTRLYPLRAIIIKNKFFFLVFFFLEKNSIKVFRNAKNFLNFFFFLSQYLKEPVGCLVFSFFYFEKIKNNIRKNQKSDFYLSILKSTNKYFSENFMRKSIFYNKLISSFSIYFLNLFFETTKKEKFFIKIESKHEYILSDILEKKQDFGKKIIEIFFQNFDFIELKPILFSKQIKKSKVKRIFTFSLESKEKYFLILKPVLKSFFSVKKKIIQTYIKSEKKKNRMELALKSNLSTIGFYLPIHVLKNTNLFLVFWVPIRYKYHFFEILWGTKKINLVRYEPHFLPSFLPKNFFLRIEIFQEINVWANFLKIFKNRIWNKFFYPLGFLNLLNQKKIFYQEKEKRKRSLYKSFFFELLFLLEENNFFLSQVMFLLEKNLKVFSNKVRKQVQLLYCDSSFFSDNIKEYFIEFRKKLFAIFSFLFITYHHFL